MTSIAKSKPFSICIHMFDHTQIITFLCIFGLLSVTIARVEILFFCFFLLEIDKLFIFFVICRIELQIGIDRHQKMLLQQIIGII